MGQPVNVEEFEALARERLDRGAHDYVSGGAEDEATLRENRAAFQRRFLRPRVLVGAAEQTLTTTVLGMPLAFPVLVAPTGFHQVVHPAGEVETVRGAVAVGALLALSAGSSCSLEEVAAAAGPEPRLWFHIYCHSDRELTEWMAKRAQAAGYRALVVAVDASRLGRRERDLRNDFKLWNLRLGNYEDIPPGITASLVLNPSLSWDDIAWLRSITTLPILLKGIVRADDAKRAVDLGVNGVWVSNHGGRQLDGVIATLDALPAIAAAVGEKVTVIVDGGVRRGTDVLKALALGADAVAVGRPPLWGLAAAGAPGVQRVLEMLRDELSLAMALSGCRSLEEIDASLVA